MESLGIDIERHIRSLAISAEVPSSVEDFIASGGKEENKNFLSSLKEKKFYKTIMDESAAPTEQAKALSSLVTHTLIEHGNTGVSAKTLSKPIRASKVMESLSSFLNEGDSSRVKESCQKLRDMFNTI